MKKKLAIIVFFFFIIIYFLSSNVFGYSDVTVQQDLYYYAYQDTLVVQNFLRRSNIVDPSSFASYLRERYPDLSILGGDFLYFGILHSNPYHYDVVFYSNDSLSNATIVNNYEYYGIISQGFTISNGLIVRMSSNSSANNFVYSAQRFNNITLPSIYYKNSREILFSHLDVGLDYNNILNTINDNISNLHNDISSNTQVQQETQNFVKSENEVADNTINDFTNDINVDSVDSSAGTNIFELFGIIDSQQNEQTTEIPINFSFFGQNVSFTVDRFLTGNFLYTAFGNTVGDIVSNVIRFIWTYFIFIFIVKNILSLIDKIKAGEIDKISPNKSNNIRYNVTNSITKSSI